MTCSNCRESVLHRPEIAAVVDLELDLGAGHARRPACADRRSTSVRLMHGRPHRLLAREGQQLAHQHGRAVGVALDLHQIGEARIRRPGRQQADGRRTSRIAVSTLLKSCAMPPASVPTAFIFCVCAIWFSSAFCSVISTRIDDRRLFRRLVALVDDGIHIEAEMPRSRRPDAANRSGRYRPCRSLAAASASSQSRPVASRGRRASRARRAPRRPARQRPENSFRNGALVRRMRPSPSTEAIAIGVLLKKRCEAHRARSTPTGRSRRRWRAQARWSGFRPARRRVSSDTRWTMRTGRLWPLALRRSRSSVLVFFRPGSACTDCTSVSPSPATRSRDGHRARLELREIDAQPVGKRRVDVEDLALPAGGEETGRRMIEIVDGVLQFLEEALLIVALGGDVGDLPEIERVARRSSSSGSTRAFSRNQCAPEPAEPPVGRAA